MLMTRGAAFMRAREDIRILTEKSEVAEKKEEHARDRKSVV